jgi:hypothetical protein
MDETTIPSRDDDHRTFQQMMAFADGPAYARRARRVHGAFEDLLARCQKKRDEWLTFVRIALGTLRGLAGEWKALRPCVRDDESLDVLRRLYDELLPRLRVPVEPTTSVRKHRAALAELIDGLERFNRRWLAYAAELDLRPINELREGYNRWYLLEKELALRNAAAARFGFQRLPPLTVEEVLQRLPPLGVPRPA